MIHKIKEILKLLSLPLILLGMYLIGMILWKIFELPSDDQMLILVKTYFIHYGLWVVFFSAVIEGFLLLGQYFPGGFIIFLGVISAGKDIIRAASVVGIVCIAFLIAYTLNYLVGKYGWYRLLAKFGLSRSLERSKDKLIRRGLYAIFLSYWEPNLASLIATSAGILRVKFGKFLLYSAAGIIFWNICWGILIFILGEAALKIDGIKWIITVFLIWIAVILMRRYFIHKRPQS